METAKSRTLSQGDLVLYRKNKRPFILHPYNSVPAISSSLAPSSSSSSSGLTTNNISRSSAETALSIEATATDTPSFPVSVPIPSLDSSPPSNANIDLLPVATLTLSEGLLVDDVNDVDKEMNGELNDDKKIDKEKMKEKEVEIEVAEMVDGGNQSDMSIDHVASTVEASIATINTMDVVDSHPTASTVYSSITDKVIPSNSDLVAEILPIKDTINSNNEKDGGRITINVEQINHIDKNSSPAEILDLEPRSEKIPDVDPRSHPTILEHVNPHNTTESIHTDSFDNFDEGDIDSYFDCLTDSKSWDESDICALLNDSEIHEVVEELVLKVIEKVSKQYKEKLISHSPMDVVSDSKDVIKDSEKLEIIDDSNTVKIESKDGYDNDNDKNDDKGVTISDSTHSDINLDSNELALLRYQKDCSAGLDDVAHKDYYAWQTSRRWTAATVKVLLQALIEYVSFILPPSPSLSLSSIASDD